MNKKWYICEPDLNKECRKTRCFIYGGPCDMTSNPEYGLKDGKGNPIEVNPRKRLKEKMKAKKSGTGAVRKS